ncbi:MAG: glycosyltransferase 87 family protein, partial [Pseudomonadota bacterium]
GPVWRFAILALAAFSGALGLANIAPHVLEGHPRAIPVDFSAFWAAGKSWAAGASPYGETYTQVFQTYGIPHLHDRPPPYFYPPNTILLTIGLGFLSFGAASAVYAWLNLAAFIVAALLFATLFSSPANGSRFAVYSFLYLCVCGLFWKAGEVVFLQNTPAFFFYAAFMACLLGVAKTKTWLFGIGLFIALMKPQFGLPLLTAGLLLPSTRKASLIAVVATGVTALLGLAAGAPQSLIMFFENIGTYGAYSENAPLNVSGIGHLVYLATGFDLPKAVLLACAIGLITAAAHWSRLDRKSANWPVALVLFAGISSCFILPSHNNYYLALAPAFLLLPVTRRSANILVASALATMFAWSIAAFLAQSGIGYLQFNTALIDSIAVSAVFALSLGAVGLPGPRFAYQHFHRQGAPLS